MTKQNSSTILMNRQVRENLLRAEAVAAAAWRIAQFVKHLAKAFSRRRQIATLAALDDRTLRDIGVSRGDVQNVMSQPFWASKPVDSKRWGRPSDKSLDALARLNDGDICHLSETGQRLRREARHPR